MVVPIFLNFHVFNMLNTCICCYFRSRLMMVSVTFPLQAATFRCLMAVSKVLMLICPSGGTPRRYLWSSTVKKAMLQLVSLSWKYSLKEKKCGKG